MADTPNDEARATDSDAAATKTNDAEKKEVTTKVSAVAASAPEWDDDEGGIGFVGLLVQFGPILLLILLVLVLDSRGDGAQAGVDLGSGDVGIAPELLPVLSDGGTMELSESLDPWALDSSNVGGDARLKQGEFALIPNAKLLEDPAAYYWGPAIVDEFPPAPSAQEFQQ